MLKHIPIILASFIFGILVGYSIRGGLTVETIVGLLSSGSALTVIELWGTLRERSKDRKEERRRELANLQSHTQILLPELREMTLRPFYDDGGSVLQLVLQHIKTGYSELWELWEGRKGIKVVRSKYAALRDAIPGIIETSFKKQVQERLPEYDIIHLEDRDWFRDDITEILKRKLFNKESIVLRVDSAGDGYSILAIRPNHPTFPFNFHVGSKEELENIAAIMNGLLDDPRLLKSVKSLSGLEQKLNQTSAALATRLRQVVWDIDYAVSDEDKILLGRCNMCKDLKRKMNIS